MENLCVCCGTRIPEGSQVCRECIIDANSNYEIHKKKVLDIFKRELGCSQMPTSDCVSLGCLNCKYHYLEEEFLDSLKFVISLFEGENL